MYDYTIVGAGYGGLSAAAMLSQIGSIVLLVKKVKNIGG
jgi:phytoene dehydrogenase-like protein